MERQGVMPKINIDGVAVDGMRVEVGWDVNQQVQVGTTYAKSPFNLSGDDEPEPFYGWFATLDRDHCNRLIRALRKARDSAYGADA